MNDTTTDKLQRKRMTASIAGAGVTDPRVLSAFEKIPRHEFVPDRHRTMAYSDTAVPIGYNQTISQPSLIGLLLEKLKLKGTETVLDIGTGSGYQAALLSCLSRWVYSIEIVPELATSAGARLKRLGISRATVLQGDGSLGWPRKKLFDRIVAGAAAKKVPKILEHQLSDKGMIIMPIYTLGAGQQLRVGVKSGLRVKYYDWLGVVYVPLVTKTKTII